MKVILEKKDTECNKVYRFNKRQKKGYYYIRGDSNQRQFCKQIGIEDFQKLPTGFYQSNGYGLRGTGPYPAQ